LRPAGNEDRYDVAKAAVTEAAEGAPICGPTLAASFLKMVDDWRRKQGDLPSRSEAIRRLVELGRKPKNDGEGRKQRQAWSAKEDERLRELAVSSATLSEIAEKLNRTKSAIQARAYTLRANPAALPVEMGLKVKGK